MRHFAILLLFIMSFFQTIANASLPIIQHETPFPYSFIFKPNDNKPHPGIVILHGSEGGVMRAIIPHAMVLAASGFSVMTLCWHDCKRSPYTDAQIPIENVDLEKTVAAMKWLKESDYVGKNQKLGLYGFSRGAEHALIIGSLQEQIDVPIDAIAVHAPADVIIGSFSWSWIDNRCWVCTPEDKACHDDLKNWNPSCGKIYGDHQSIDDLRVWRWQGKYLPLDERIQIEKFTNPIMITCGDKDTVWPSDMTRRIEESLKRAGRNPEVHMFPDQDHIFTIKAEQERKQIADEFFHRVLDH